MFKKIIKLIYIVILFNFLLLKSANTEIVKSIKILGNERIADETIIMFSKIKIGSDLDKNDINNSLRSLYESNFFENVSIKLIQNNLTILVKENAIIENISFEGIKSNTLKEKILEDINIKSRSSYSEILLKETKSQIISSLRNLGYYFAEVEIDLIDLDDNKVDLIFNINLGDKAKIKKITFIGNKIFKDSKLKNLIVSEEYKFWKIISGKKYLNENLIKFDTRLLRNFYLNKGYYDVNINSSYAKLINDDEFEIVFNIDAKNKFYFGDLNLDLPVDFKTSNFENLNKTFDNLKNKTYSINSVEKIIDEIDKISVNEQYESISANVIENIVDNKINLTFKIEETEKYFIKKINIFGNNITRENVIRNQFYVDEGDPYNEILAKKSVNEIKSLNFFKSVESQIISDDVNKTKIINITVEEKPTGEIMAGAGFGTDGEVIEFGVKENNYLGKGLKVSTNLSVGSDKIVGNFDLENPNINNTDKSVNLEIKATEIDRLTAFGYKSKKIGGSVGTKFEYLEDFTLGFEASTFVEDISTDSSASARQRKQEGDYFDTYLGVNFDYDKRNQKFQTNDGFRSFYSLDLPIISDNNTVTNYYNYKVYSELYENNISSLSISLSSANSITGDDIKLSERLYIPQKRLRGFVKGKVGPKDGSDYIGGNYYSTVNLSSTLPQVLPNLENIDVSTFFDIGNVWGVDDSSLDESSEIRSSIGIGVDWFTVVGPLSFSFAQPITKADTDAEETFRFNLGTTF